MKLLEVKIDGFGQLSQQHFNVDAPIIVIYGANEAGKSTLFQFIYTMFYGFARKNQLAQFKEPIHGGLHGGSLIFMDEQQKVYEIMRHRQQQQGKVNIAEVSWDEQSGSWMPSEQFSVMEQPLFERLYLSSMNARLFRELCAVTLDELQATSLMTEEELSQYLYHASWESGKHITALEKHLQLEMNEIFRPRGQNQRLNQHYKELDSLYKQGKQAVNDIVKYNELIEEINKEQFEASQLRDRTLHLDEELQQLKKAISQRQWWLEEQQAQYYLQKLDHSTRVPQETAQIWDEMSKQRNDIEVQLEQYEFELTHIKQKLSQYVHLDTMEAGAAEAEQLIQQWPKIEQLQQEFDRRQEELLRLEGRIEEEYQQLPSSLRLEELQHLLISTDEHYDYEQLKESFIGCETQFRRIKEAADQLRYTQRMLEQQQSNLIENIDNQRHILRKCMKDAHIIPVEKTTFLDAVAVAEAACRQYEYNIANGKRDFEQKERLVRTNRVDSSTVPLFPKTLLLSAMSILALVSVLGMIFLITDIHFIPRNTLIAILSASVFSGLLLAMLFRFMHIQARNIKMQVPNLATDPVLAVRQVLSGLIEMPLLPESPQHYYECKRTLFEKIGHVKQLYNELDRMDLGRVDLSKKQEQLTAELNVKEQDQQRYEQELSYLDDNWKRQLEYKGLPEHLSIYDFEKLVKLLPHIQASIAQKEYIQQLLIRYQVQVEQFKKAVSGLQTRGWATAGQAGELEYIITMMGQQLKQYNEQEHERQLEQKEAQLLEQKIAKAVKQLERCSAAIGSLLERAGASDEEQLIGLLKAREEHADWEQKRQMNYVRRTAGQSSAQIAAIEALYQQFDLEELYAKEETLMQEATAIDEQHQQKVEVRGRLLQEQDTLVQSSVKQQLELNIAAAEATIMNELRQYRKLALGKALVVMTKELYEQERQPAVLAKASQYFQLLTNGKYNRIITNAERQSLQLRTQEGVMIESELLSRGAAEQLYLAIRLAIHHEAADSRVLPLLLDDPFVNFDHTRLKQAMFTLEMFGESRQCLYFTCHKHILQHFEEHFPMAKTIEMMPTISLV